MNFSPLQPAANINNFLSHSFPSLSIFFLQFFFIFFVRIIKGKKGEEKFKKEAKSLIKKYFGYLCVSKEEEEEEGLNELS